jgi:hypothetical protein
MKRFKLKTCKSSEWNEPVGLPNRSCKEQAATLFEHQRWDLHKTEQKE